MHSQPQLASHATCVQTQERAGVEKAQGELTAAKAALSTAIADARQLERQVSKLRAVQLRALYHIAIWNAWAPLRVHTCA